MRVLFASLLIAALWPTFQWSPGSGGPWVDIPLDQIGTSWSDLKGNTLTFARNSVGTYIDGAGARQTASANQPRVESAGLLVELQRTNYLLNSTSPVDQETGSLSTGVHTAWIEGAGSVDFAVGTATATGLPCTATAASACAFNVTVAGTVTATLDGVVTAFQLENGATATSLIITAGASATRLKDDPRVTLPAKADMTRQWYATMIPSNLGTATDQLMLSTSAGGVANSFLLGRSGSSFYFSVYDAAAAVRSSSKTSTNPPIYQNKRVVVCDGVYTPRMYIDGADIGPTTTGAGTGILSATRTTVYIGSAAGNYQFMGHIKSLKIGKGCRP